jgi:hypothetical protein
METRRRGERRWARPTLLAAILGGLVTTGGCGSDVVVVDAGAGGGPIDFQSFGKMQSSGIDKIDLLLVVDNSRSMADKQQILAATIPDLIRGLANPPCEDPVGTLPPQQTPSPLDACPAGMRRRFSPIRDIHLGIVTSSLGGHGSDACPAVETFSCPGGVENATNNDMGHLVARLDPCSSGAVPTYESQGFLAWDPAGQDAPPGETKLGSVNVDPQTGAVTTGQPGLLPSLKDLVLGTGQVGCGYESSLEGWYRFLVDPEPYQTLTVDPATLRAEPQGLDQVLLQQRKDFLRASSLLAIIGISDENDCSIKEYGQFWFAAQQRDPQNPNKNFYLPKARSECATNPSDPCCRSCGQDQGSCPFDPNCGGTLDAKTDDVNLRCWDQKRRFGIDFLYPIDRYVTGLSQPLVANRAGDLVPNPIFADLDPADGNGVVRDSSMVLLTYLVGVPWQYLAKDPSDAGQGFKDASWMSQYDAQGHTPWDYVLGDPASFVPPLDPLMIESSSPRKGQSPLNGAALAPPSSLPGPGPNPINGHEYTPGTKDGVPTVPDDLEYACIFDLPQPRDCADPSLVSCDCSDPKNDNPLCEPVDPADPTSPRTRQARAKGYPGLRQLALVKALGFQAQAGSICPAQLTDPSAPSYGYRPALQHIFDRLTSVVDGQCFQKSLPVDPAGQVACAVVEARNTGEHLDAASCDAFCAKRPGRIAVPAAHAKLRDMVLTDPLSQSSGLDCACEIPQLGGQPGCGVVSSPLAACQCDPAEVPVFDGQSVDGWCYVDAMTSPPVGDPEILKNCPDTEKRLLRFVGAGIEDSGTTILFGCVAP